MKTISGDVIEQCRSFIGAKRVVKDSLSREPAVRLAVLLQRRLGKELPLCWHWAYFNTAVPSENLGHDGHERLGVFLPDVPLGRRMWAAGEIDVISPLVIGVPAIRTTTIKDVAFKDGRTGALCFVTLLHEIDQPSGPLHKITGLRGSLREEQIIVYRQPGQPDHGLRKHSDPVPEGYQVIDDTSLLAYSAITHNGHRIHWDRDFCRNVEHYPDLVVHGPLLATMLAGQFAAAPKPASFQFRAQAPVFVTSPIRIDVPDQDPDEYPQTATIVRSDGTIAMTATYTPL